MNPKMLKPTEIHATHYDGDGNSTGVTCLRFGEFSKDELTEDLLDLFNIVDDSVGEIKVDMYNIDCCTLDLILGYDGKFYSYDIRFEYIDHIDQIQQLLIECAGSFKSMDEAYEAGRTAYDEVLHDPDYFSQE